ncbi:hypothetical protein OG21DRAFT_250269 [Imleria badia]|nr:hypothetical protein OG21DRAFT_250269 [Imleria badia]
MDLSADFHLLSRNTRPPHETALQTDPSPTGPPSLADETSCSRSLSGDEDSLPSLSYSPSEPSSSALSRSSSVASSACLQPSLDENSSMDSHDIPATTVDHDEDDPLSYHSDFDYYTQSFSDHSDSEPDHDPAAHSPPLNTPYTSLYDPAVQFEPGSSADTMRRVSVPRQRAYHAIDPPNLESPQEWRGVPARQDDRRGRNAGHCGPGGGAGGDDKSRRSKPHLSISDYTSSSDDDADGITVYYSLDGMSNGPRSRSPSRTHSKVGGGSDDDVPLAQRVPTALSAQKSIRKQLHDERQQRRLERARSRRTAEPPLPSHPTEPLPAPAEPTRFRKRSVSAAPAPGSGSRTAPIEAFPVEDLTRKLMNLQTCSRTPSFKAPPTYDSAVPTNPPHRVPGYSAGVSRSSSRGRYKDQATYLQQKAPRLPEASAQDRPLRTMRSFHRPDGRHSETQRSPTDQTSAPRLGRSATAAASSRTTRAGRDAASVGYEQHPKSARVSEDSRRPSATVPRSSIDDVAQRAVQRPPVPPLPISDSTPPQQMSRVPVVQQRIFIGDMQRFNMVEITPATNAGDVIDTVARQGMLERSGSWMVFEMAQDYGMERPIRDYELLADVSASWNKDKLLNAFVIKKTPLAPLLSRSALPTSSPTYRGWVEWESKRGKWSKRWMELREHGLWLSKRDTGKDEAFLCSLSNFDAYFVTRRHKSPKGFVFGIKSTDHLSLFENTADYLHVFSCNPKDGEKWMQAVLVARSYVLYQERNVLFAKTGESLSQAKPLVRSRTRKQSVSNRPAQPLVNVPPPFSQAPTANVAFEPGSLLAKRNGDAHS